MPTIYLAMEDALRVFTQTTDEWTATDHLTNQKPECVAATQADLSCVYCGTFNAGLHQSTDGGTTWSQLTTPVIQSDSITAITIAPTDPDSIWAGTEPSALYHSIDGGNTWIQPSDLTDLESADKWSFPPRPDTHHVRWIEPDPNDPDRLYVGIEAGALLVTTDAGHTWTDRPTGTRYDNHQLTTHPDAPGRVYAAAGDGYAESTNGGDTWSHPQTGLDHRYVWSVAVDPTDPDHVYISAANGAQRAHYPSNPESYIYTKHGTDPWHVLDNGLPSGPGVLRSVLHPGLDHGTMYAANNHGIYTTENGGDSWDQLDLPWPDRFTDQTVRGLGLIP